MAKLYNHVKGLIASLSALMIMAGGSSASARDAADDDLDKALDQIQVAARDPLADVIQLVQATPRGIDWVALIEAAMGKSIGQATPLELEFGVVDSMVDVCITRADYLACGADVANSVIPEVGVDNTEAIEAVERGILAAAPLELSDSPDDLQELVDEMIDDAIAKAPPKKDDDNKLYG